MPRQYRRSSPSSPAQFPAASGSEWAKEQLEWISVDFEDGLNLFADDPDGEAIFSADYSRLLYGVLASKIRRELGSPWADVIQNNNSISYSYLSALSMPTPVTRPWEASSSFNFDTSLPASPQSQDAQPVPPSPHHSDSSHVPPSPQPPHQFPVLNTSSPSRPDQHPPETPPRSSPPAFVTAAATPRTQAETTHRPSSSTSSQQTDDTYVQDPSPRQRPAQPLTEDKSEAEVQQAALACLQAVGEVLYGISQQRLTPNIEYPDTLYLVVDGFSCTTKPDLRFSLRSNDPCNSYVEVKRLQHGLSFDQVLGQEVCHLLALASLQHAQKTPTTRTRSHSRQQHAATTTPPSGRKMEPQGQEPSQLNDSGSGSMIKAYLVSWHHLTGYITRLQVGANQLETGFDTEPAAATSSDSIKTSRSKTYNLQDADQRVEFFLGAVTVAVRTMGKMDRGREILKRITALADPKAD